MTLNYLKRIAWKCIEEESLLYKDVFVILKFVEYVEKQEKERKKK